MLPLAVVDSAAVALALLAASGLLYGPSLAATFDVRRRCTPPAFLGQVFTTAASVKSATFALGAAASGALVAAIGAGDTIFLAAAMHLAASAIGALLLEFRLR